MPSHDPRTQTSPPPVVAMMQYADEADHFAGVEGALAARSIRGVRVNEWEVGDLDGLGAGVVIVKDTQSPLALRALRWARQARGAAGARVATLLLMDGVTEYRNTFLNADAGPAFLRPAPVDVVMCAGETDRVNLCGWGNYAVATGLPRIVAAFPKPLARRADGGLLIATARRPAFGAAERERLIGALRELHAAVEGSVWRGRVAWRLTAGLEEAIGVQNAGGSLGDALRDAAAVMTTPSTLLLEAMSAGRACAIVHPQPGPLWQEAMFVWRGEEAGELRAVVDGLAAPSEGDWQRQGSARARMHAAADGVGAAERVADAVVRVLRGEIGEGPGRRCELEESSRFQAQSPRIGDNNSHARLRRVVSCVSCDSTPIGGVMSWSLRMGREFAERGAELGYEFRTLVVAMQPEGWRSEEFDPMSESGVDLCVIDPLSAHHERVETIRAALAALSPDIVLPNYNDVCFMAAAMLRPQGVRTVAIAHADDVYYRQLAATYDTWSAGVGVSGVCVELLREIAAGRPVEQVVYGVPVAAGATARPGAKDASARLRLGYIGRMVEEQKRIGDLATLMGELERLGVAAELHMVGDGPELGAWRTRLGGAGLVHGSVAVHGRRSPAWVERFLPTLDACVLVSAYEGTSVVMLEAMGQGVVPVVTAVRSGVSEWVRDGENGIVVPIGDMAAMARGIARLSRDRALLGAMSAAAWETIRGSGLSVGATARAYARVFDAAMAHGADPRPSDTALRPMVLWRWNKGGVCGASGRAADAWCERALHEAGYREIALDAPPPGCDAVLVRSTRIEPVSAAEIAAWREAGLGVAVSPHLRQDGLAARVLKVVRGAVKRGHTRIAVYPAGRHTRRIAEAFRPELWPESTGGSPFVGFLDDAARPGQQSLGLPVVRPEEAIATLMPDAVLLSSDVFEDALWERTAFLRERGVEVLRVYGGAHDEQLCGSEVSVKAAGNLRIEAHGEAHAHRAG